jgi:hypothetical protein
MILDAKVLSALQLHIAALRTLNAAQAAPAHVVALRAVLARGSEARALLLKRVKARAALRASLHGSPLSRLRLRHPVPRRLAGSAALRAGLRRAHISAQVRALVISAFRRPPAGLRGKSFASALSDPRSDAADRTSAARLSQLGRQLAR